MAILCDMFNLTPKQAKFARLYFETGKVSESYRGSYDAEGMTDSSVATAASDLLKHPQVVAYIADMTDSAEWAAMLSVSWVLKQYMKIATADVNELVEQRQECCRYCHGIGHAYQYVDVTEWAADIQRVMKQNESLEQTNKRASKPAELYELPTFDGGAGFWATKEPHPNCPKCFGIGQYRTHLHDTRKTKSPLYAGVKMTSTGPEIKLRDQDAALAYLAKYLGIDPKTLEISGPGGGPIRLAATVKAEDLTDDQLAALVELGIKAPDAKSD